MMSSWIWAWENLYGNGPLTEKKIPRDSKNVLLLVYIPICYIWQSNAPLKDRQLGNKGNYKKNSNENLQVYIFSLHNRGIAKQWREPVYPDQYFEKYAYRKSDAILHKLI